MRKLTLIDKKNEYPSRLSPIALTFEAEIKRLAEEKGLSIEATMTKLAGFTGISTSQLYNYRCGKTPIPADHIPVFCKQFESNALAMTVLNMCSETPIDELDGLDHTRLCNKSVRAFLEAGAVYQEVMEDGVVDGHEEIRFSGVHARVGAANNRMLENLRAARRQRMGTSPAAA